VVFLRFSLNIRKGMGYREFVASALSEAMVGFLSFPRFT
jgi:hypothetical protein